MLANSCSVITTRCKTCVKLKIHINLETCVAQIGLNEDKNRKKRSIGETVSIDPSSTDQPSSSTTSTSTQSATTSYVSQSPQPFSSTTPGTTSSTPTESSSTSTSDSTTTFQQTTNTTSLYSTTTSSYTSASTIFTSTTTPYTSTTPTTTTSEQPEPKTGVWIDCLIHAREWIAGTTCMLFINKVSLEWIKH